MTIRSTALRGRASLLCLAGLGLGILIPSAWGQDLRYPPTPQQRQQLIEQGWAAGRDSLAAALQKAYLPGMGGRPGSTGTRGYGEWMTLWKWCDLMARTEQEEVVALLARHLYTQDGENRPAFLPPGFPPGEDMRPAPPELAAQFLSDGKSRSQLLRNLLPAGMREPEDAPIADRLDPQIVAGWAADPAFSAMLFSTISPDDYAPGVLLALQEIQQAHPDKFKTYMALALAIAVVYDTRLPRFWPHNQVDPKLVPRAEVSAADRFAAWVRADEARHLLTKLSTMRPGHLKFVIDAPLAESEYEWARKNAKFPHSGFAKAFSAVPYKSSRISAQEFVWNTDEYTLENILGSGGICVDQAYFAMVAGKARGLPTLFFTGQGADGGHAWFGFMKTGERWELDAGRYENQNYAAGVAMDPQNWKPILDHDLKGLTEGFRDTPTYLASRDDLILAELFERTGDSALAGKALESAVSVCPQNPLAWEARGTFLARSGAPADTRKKFHEAALRQFETRRDLRVRHQEALSSLARDVGDTATASAIEKQIISQNRVNRSDLSVSAASRQLSGLVDDGLSEDAFKEYRRLLSSLKETGGGNFFYEIVRPFVNSLRSGGDNDRAKQALEMARKALNPSAGSILDQEFDKLEKPKARDNRRNQ